MTYICNIIYSEVGIKNLIIAGIFFFIVFGANVKSFAQDDDKKVIQFSGVVVEKDSTVGIPGVHIYVPGKRRGTAANYYGYFSFPVLVGDTVLFSAVGYHKKQFIIQNSIFNFVNNITFI